MRRALEKSSGMWYVSLVLMTVGVTCGAAGYPRPGRQLSTPVTQGMLDSGAYKVGLAGKEYAPKGRGGGDGPRGILWTNDGRGTSYAGLSFGVDKIAGPRHLRVGLTQAVPVGSVFALGNVSVSVLKPNAAYPGRLSDASQWVKGQRIAIGKLTTDQPKKRNALTFWVFPAGTTTRALRFTHMADVADPKYEGWLGGSIVLSDRMIGLESTAITSSMTNNRHARKITNGVADGWGAWENISTRVKQAQSYPQVSTRPEWIMMTWPERVALDGLIGVETGFGGAEILGYKGPADLHPRDSSDKHWKPIASISGFEHAYPINFWPNYLAFGKTIRTRAIRIRVNKVTRVAHPHVMKNTVDGRRVWVGELMPVQNIKTAPLAAPKLAKANVNEPHPPIPIKFTLPEEGYVTLVIEDKNGKRVRNLVSETRFPAGKNIAWWDGTHDLDRDIDAAKHGLYSIPAKFVEPGAYKARGLWRKEIVPKFEFAVYSAGSPPWGTPDHTGAWLANHSAPKAAVAVPASHSPTGEPAVFLGCYVTEGPDGLAWVDLDGRKRGGMKWVGGVWTAAPFLCRDTAKNADPKISAYVGSIWSTGKNSGVYELRLSALHKTGQTGGRALRAKPVCKLVLTSPEVAAARKAELKKAPRKQYKNDDPLASIAAYNGVIACAFPKSNRIRFIQATGGGKEIGVASVRDPRSLVYDAEGALYVLTGTRVLRSAPVSRPGTISAKPRVLVKSGLEDPVAMTVDAAGNIYVSDRGNSHQVKVFSASGKRIRSIGRAGTPRPGPYDPLHMNNPAGLAVDEKNQIWVTEEDYLPKRVSVWSRDGKLIRAFYGPGKYGGGGMLDCHDKTKFYYAAHGGTLEFTLDWEAGTSKLNAVLFRKNEKTMKFPFRTQSPEKAIYHKGKRYFTNCFNNNPVAGHGTAFLFIERGGLIHPAVAMGRANQWEILKTDPFLSLWPNGMKPRDTRYSDKNQAFFIWSDRNNDAQVQPNEVKLYPAVSSGITVMDDLSFCVAKIGSTGRASGTSMRFKPTSFTSAGVPLYDYAKGESVIKRVIGPKSTGGCQMLADDSDEAIVTLGVEPFHSHSVCGTKNGEAVWSYPNPWPGLHASHEAAKPDRPGQLIGVTRIMGNFVHPKNSEVGPIWAVNANMGNFYLMTRDGLFVATVFEDVRQGKLWKMPVAERGMSLKGISLHDENFWPSIGQSKDGTIYAVDGANCSLVRLDGLDTLRRINVIPVTVTVKDLAASQRYVMELELARKKQFGSGVLEAALRKSAPKVDGRLDDWKGANWVDIDNRGAGANFNSDAKPYSIKGTMAVAGERLYAAWTSLDKKLVVNSGEVPNALFKSGGCLDIMLATKSGAEKRRQGGAGDLRLLVAQVNKKTKALLYRPVAPGAKGGKVPFSSPWRTIFFDQVLDVSSQVQFGEDGTGNYEISIPLATLGLRVKNGLKMKGDIGVLRGNGSETTARSYWSNKATGITADVPSEAMLLPHLWGTIEWKSR